MRMTEVPEPGRGLLSHNVLEERRGVGRSGGRPCYFNTQEIGMKLCLGTLTLVPFHSFGAADRSSSTDPFGDPDPWGLLAQEDIAVDQCYRHAIDTLLEKARGRCHDTRRENPSDGRFCMQLAVFGFEDDADQCATIKCFRDEREGGGEVRCAFHEASPSAPIEEPDDPGILSYPDPRDDG